jgi:hypothetical protein
VKFKLVGVTVIDAALDPLSPPPQAASTKQKTIAVTLRAEREPKENIEILFITSPTMQKL